MLNHVLCRMHFSVVLGGLAVGLLNFGDKVSLLSVLPPNAWAETSSRASSGRAPSVGEERAPARAEADLASLLDPSQLSKIFGAIYTVIGKSLA